MQAPTRSGSPVTTVSCLHALDSPRKKPEKRVGSSSPRRPKTYEKTGVTLYLYYFSALSMNLKVFSWLLVDLNIPIWIFWRWNCFKAPVLTINNEKLIHTYHCFFKLDSANDNKEKSKKDETADDDEEFVKRRGKRRRKRGRDLSGGRSAFQSTADPETQVSVAITDTEAFVILCSTA